MSDRVIGCQTITFGESQSDRFPDVFGAVASAGYAGVEIGFRHIRRHRPGDLLAMLGAHDLTLIASHIGGNLFDPAGAKQEQTLIDEILDYLNACGTTRLMYSGLRFESTEQFGRDFERLCRAAETCATRGVSLLYHNHDWEFADANRVLESVVIDAPQSLGLCPDLGWVMKGGRDPLTLLKFAQTRVGAVHFKDFATATPGTVDTVLLGQGAAPLRKCAEWIRANLPGVPVIAEQDVSQVPPAEAIGHNALFMRSVFP